MPEQREELARIQSIGCVYSIVAVAKRIDYTNELNRYEVMVTAGVSMSQRIGLFDQGKGNYADALELVMTFVQSDMRKQLSNADE